MNTRNTAAAEPCPLCKGLGFVTPDVPVGDPEYGKVYPCRCQSGAVAEKRAHRLLRLSNLGRLAECTFASFLPDGVALNEADRRNLHSAWEAARAFAENPTGWLMLTGTYGSGKTHLAAAIANHIIGRGEGVLFVVVPDLLDHLRATFAPNSKVPYDQLFEEVRNAPCLVLDDFGAHNATPWALEKLYQILNHRYNNRLPTVITTNNELEDLDPRLRSRLTDESLVRSVAITAPDYRGSGASGGLAELSTLAFHASETFESFNLRRGELESDDREFLQQALAAAQDYADSPKGWLVFQGDHYSGKTHLAAAIANYRVAHGYPALFVVVSDLLDHLRAAYDPATPVSYDKRLQQVKRAPLLIMDDYGVHSSTAWAQEKLYQLFGYRFNAMLPTVITTSLTLEQIDARLKARLMDKSRCLLVPISSPPYRGAGRQRATRSRKS
ncbi:MAG: ATP-binding protein [Anaerolineae bacterium]